MDRGGVEHFCLSSHSTYSVLFCLFFYASVFLILYAFQCEEEGRLYYTMDDGQTRFADLIQLVEFHQINRGILPCKLKHYCTCVAL